MQDLPSADAIEKLASAPSREEGQSSFEARMIGAALELVKRERAMAPESDQAERQRLVALLGEGGELEQLNCRLCMLIRDGALDLSSPGVAAHLRAIAMEKLAVDQPTYAAYKRALEIAQG